MVMKFVNLRPVHTVEPTSHFPHHITSSSRRVSVVQLPAWLLVGVLSYRDFPHSNNDIFRDFPNVLLLFSVWTRLKRS